jgi:hypothetical protein
MKELATISGNVAVDREGKDISKGARRLTGKRVYGGVSI